jgi:hypothetical protein
VTSPLRRALAAAIVVPALLTFGACKAEVSAGGGIDSSKIADQVKDAQQKATPDLDVTDETCDDVDDPAVGDTVDCSVTIDGVEAPYTATFTTVDDDGVKFDIEPTKAIVSVEKAVNGIEDEYVKQGYDGVEVDCGDAAIVVDDPGATFDCTATQGGRTQDVTVTIKDLDGNIDFTN